MKIFFRLFFFWACDGRPSLLEEKEEEKEDEKKDSDMVNRKRWACLYKEKESMCVCVCVCVNMIRKSNTRFKFDMSNQKKEDQEVWWSTVPAVFSIFFDPWPESGRKIVNYLQTNSNEINQMWIDQKRIRVEETNRKNMMKVQK